jgi:hypothetical protein
MASAVVATAERRSSIRLRPIEDAPALVCRIRPGHAADILDLSERGALLEARRRLLPGSVIELQWEADGRRDVTRARVLRCEVAIVMHDTIVFRAAVGFERDLPLVPAAGRAWRRME